MPLPDVPGCHMMASDLGRPSTQPGDAPNKGDEGNEILALLHSGRYRDGHCYPFCALWRPRSGRGARRPNESHNFWHGQCWPDRRLEEQHDGRKLCDFAVEREHRHWNDGSATKLEVNGEAKVDSSFFVTGSITLGGNILSSQTLGALIQAPNDGSYNFGAGLYSLGPLTTGSSNTAIGDNVLTFNTNGASNTGVGAYALYANTTGIQNTAAGVQALDANSTGQGNTAVGYRALLGNNASQNTAVGAIALLADTQGEDNTATGYYALANNTTGNNNTAVGASALANNSTGSNNVAIGEFAGANVTTSNNIHIGNYGTASDSGHPHRDRGHSNLRFHRRHLRRDYQH